jgi:hypothetical protein
MASFNKFNITVQDLGDGLFNLNSDTLNDMLSNTAPVATNTVYSSITEISNGNGYTTGGATIGSTAFSQSSGLATLTGNNVVWTASGGTIGPFRYVVIYDVTSSTKPLIGWWDYGSSITLNAGETFTVNHSSGILTLQ